MAIINDNMRQLVPHVSTYAGPRNKGTEQTERGAEGGKGSLMRCNKMRERETNDMETMPDLRK